MIAPAAVIIVFIGFVLWAVTMGLAYAIPYLILLFGIIIAMVIGFLIGKDAEARGMSGLGWGVFSFLTCIIAVPIYLVVRKPRLDDRK